MKLVNFMPDPNSNLTIPEQMQKYHDFQMQQQLEQNIAFILIPIIMTTVACVMVFGPYIYRKIKKQEKTRMIVPNTWEPKTKMKKLKQHLKSKKALYWYNDINKKIIYDGIIEAVKEWLQEHQKINEPKTIYYETIEYLIKELKQ